jgi:hypothetical protein
MQTFYKGLVVSSVCSLLLAGCASAPKNIIGKETVIEKSASSKPDWIAKPWELKGKTFLITGGVTKVADYSLGLREAKAEAIKNVGEAVQVKINSLFDRAVVGQNVGDDELQKAVRDVVAVVVDNLKVSGIKPKMNYYEKIEKVTEAGLEYFYNCYTLLEMDKADYEKAVQQALVAEKTRKKDNQNAVKLLEQAEKRVFEEDQAQ